MQTEGRSANDAARMANKVLESVSVDPVVLPLAWSVDVTTATKSVCALNSSSLLEVTNEGALSYIKFGLRWLYAG